MTRSLRALVLYKLSQRPALARAKNETLLLQVDFKLSCSCIPYGLYLYNHSLNVLSSHYLIWFELTKFYFCELKWVSWLINFVMGIFSILILDSTNGWVHTTLKRIIISFLVLNSYSYLVVQWFWTVNRPTRMSQSVVRLSICDCIFYRS